MTRPPLLVSVAEELVGEAPILSRSKMACGLSDTELFKEYSVTSHGGLGSRNRTEEGEGARDWGSIPHEMQVCVLEKLDFRGLFCNRLSSKACKQYVESDDFRRRRGAITGGSFMTFIYYSKNKAWQCSAYDPIFNSWRAFPTFSTCLPSPDPKLFKEYSVTGHGGLMCAELPKGEVVVFNPSTGEKRAPPPLHHPRTPVLVHLTFSQTSFEVIVAGSSNASDEHLSRKVEVFDSVRSEGTEACDAPGPVFGLNEHQGGVCVDGTVLFIAFLKGGGRAVVGFNGFDGRWGTCVIPDYCSCNTLQLVESSGKVYLLSERERGEHCIDELELLTATKWQWRNVVRVKRCGGRSLLVYPEQTCVGFGDGKLCIFNALKRNGVVYDMRDGELLAKNSGHGDSRAADHAELVLFNFLRSLGAKSIPQKLLLTFGVLCNLLQRANAQQLTSISTSIDSTAWLTAEGAFIIITALISGGLGAYFIWKKFFYSPFSVKKGLEETAPLRGLLRTDLDAILPLVDEHQPNPRVEE